MKNCRHQDSNINADYIQLLPLLLSGLEEEIIRILSDFGYSFLSNTESKKFGWESKKRELICLLWYS
jgi:hypothetical protein